MKNISKIIIIIIAIISIALVGIGIIAIGQTDNIQSNTTNNIKNTTEPIKQESVDSYETYQTNKWLKKFLVILI